MRNTKEGLEKTKLELEIQKLNNPWYTNIEFWKTIIPSLAVIISLYFTFGQGIMDSQKAKLEVQKEQLLLDITKFESKKNKLKDTIFVKDNYKKNLEKEILELQKTYYSLSKNNKVLIEKLGISENQNKEINDLRIQDKNNYLNKLQQEYNKEKDRLESINKLNVEVEQKTKEVIQNQAEIKFYKSKVKLSKLESLELERDKLEQLTNYHSEQFRKSYENYKAQRERLTKKYELDKKNAETMSFDEVLNNVSKMINENK